MIPNVLVGLEFGKILHESTASTQTGKELLTRYQTHLLANPESCGIVNQFVKEASGHLYDNGIHECLKVITDYIQDSKTSWALASACESILRNDSHYNILQRNAAHQVEKLLEQEEDKVVRYIRSGALKNVMFCESFRNIVKQVYSEQPMVEYKADYTKYTPISMVESVGDGHCFVAGKALYKVDDAGNVSEAQWNEVSAPFKMVSSLLNASITEMDSDKIVVNYLNAKYEFENANEITKITESDRRKFTVDEFREYSNMQVMASNPRRKNEVAGMLESMAILAENLDSVVSLDNVSIYTTAGDRFMVIESGDHLYATLLESNRQAKWTIHENAIDALSFIKSKTNAELGSEYSSVVESAMESLDAEKREEISKQLQENEERSIKERIEALTERFKNDPTKLAILAKLAAESQEL